MLATTAADAMPPPPGVWWAPTAEAAIPCESTTHVLDNGDQLLVDWMLFRTQDILVWGHLQKSGGVQLDCGHAACRRTPVAAATDGDLVAVVHQSTTSNRCHVCVFRRHDGLWLGSADVTDVGRRNVTMSFAHNTVFVRGHRGTMMFTINAATTTTGPETNADGATILSLVRASSTVPRATAITDRDTVITDASGTPGFAHVAVTGEMNRYIVRTDAVATNTWTFMAPAPVFHIDAGGATRMLACVRHCPIHVLRIADGTVEGFVENSAPDGRPWTIAFISADEQRIIAFNGATLCQFVAVQC